MRESKMKTHPLNDGLQPPPTSKAEGNHFKVVTFRRASVMVADKSLLLFGKNNPIRLSATRLVNWRWFERFILLLISANTVALSLTDYSCIDKYGEPSATCSWRNQLSETSEPIFTTLFAVESSLKIISVGFLFGPTAYLRNPWNVLDFLVVSCGLIAIIPGVPNFSALRAVRVLRPLRSLSILPGLRVLVSSLLAAIPALINVIVLLCCMFLVFGILGVQLWSGRIHYRCRETPFPVRLEAPGEYPPSGDYLLKVIEFPDEYRCMSVPNNNASWTKSTSPWATPQDCFWPLVEEDVRLCGDVEGRDCPAGSYCGSNYDMTGNARFVDEKADGTALYLVDSATYSEDMNWGFTNFDNILSAFITTFQSITMEGWTRVMNMFQDGYSPVLTAVMFCCLVLYGSFFLLQLTLAVIWEEFQKAQAEEGKDGDEYGSVKPMLTEDLKQLEALDKRSSDLSKTKIPSSAMIDGRFSTTHVINAGKTGKKILGEVAEHPAFNILIIILIALNTLVMSLEHYPMDSTFEASLEHFNFILSVAFFVEMLIKVMGLGIRKYMSNAFNIFDGVIVLTGIVEMILVPPEILGGKAGASGGGLAALRTFRLFRIFKLARNWESLRVLMTTIVRTLKDVSYFGILLILFMYIYALFGMQLFANHLRFDPTTSRPVDPADEGYANGVTPRAHFDTFLWAFTTVFQILTGENWNTVMYDGWRHVGWPAVVYYLTLVMFGDWIVMNLFLAILLGNFEGVDEINETKKVAPVARLKSRLLSLTPSKSFLRRYSMRNSSEVSTGSDNEGSCKGTTESQSASHTSKVVPAQMSSDADSDSSAVRDSIGQSKSRVAPQVTKSILGISSGKTSEVPGSRRVPRMKRSLYIFSRDSIIRRVAIKVVEHEAFNRIAITLILVSSIALAVDSPLLDPSSTIARYLQLVDLLCTVLFVLEMSLKVVANGFVLGQGAYLRDEFNVLDFFVVVLSIVNIASDSSSLKAIRSFRALRALRPLRVISRHPGLKLVVNTIFRSIPAVLNMSFILLLFLTIFSIVGINYFKGGFNACQGEDFEALNSTMKDLLTYPRPISQMDPLQQQWFVECDFADTYTPTSRDVCRCWALEWGPTVPQNFDNIFSAIGSLFELTTTEGWVDVMYASVDTTGIDMQPVRDKQVLWVFFYILYMIFGSFFVLNLFIGVVIDNFMKEEKAGLLVTNEQREWLRTQKMVLRMKPLVRPRKPRSKWRMVFFRLATHARFDHFVTLCIILNTISMAVEHHGQSQVLTDLLRVSNLVFANVFYLEAAVKLAAFGRAYFRDAWNKFDFAIVVGSALGMAITLFTEIEIGPVGAIVRLCRVGRIARLLKNVKSLTSIFNTLLLSLPSLANIGSLLFLLFFIYAVMGVQLYAKVGENGALNAHQNFRSFWQALLTLISFATGENWNGFAHDLKDSNYDGSCADDPQFDSQMCGFHTFDGCIPLNGCGSWTILPFMYTFTLVITFVLLNLFVAVILDNFSESEKDQNMTLPPAQFEQFRSAWADFDPDATCYIHASNLVPLVQAIDQPLGFKGARLATTKYVIHKISQMEIPIDSENRAFFNDVMQVLADHALEQKTPTLNDILFKKNSNLHGTDVLRRLGKRKRTTKEYFAAEVLYAFFRRTRRLSLINKSENKTDGPAETEVPLAKTTVAAEKVSEKPSDRSSTTRPSVCETPVLPIEDGPDDDQQSSQPRREISSDRVEVSDWENKDATEDVNSSRPHVDSNGM